MSRITNVDQMLDVALFNAKFGIEQPPFARRLSTDLALFRLKFLVEEVQELAQAMGFHLDYKISDQVYPNTVNLEQQLDALVDLNYVSVGTALIAGFDFDEAWRRVHHANMQKERALPDGSNSSRFSQYDVVKPAGWTPPDLSDLVTGSHVAPVQQDLLIEVLRDGSADPVTS